MEFVAFLEDLCDGICWMFVISWHCLNSHVIVMVKFSIGRNFFDALFFESMNQAFLHHF